MFFRFSQSAHRFASRFPRAAASSFKKELPFNRWHALPIAMATSSFTSVKTANKNNEDKKIYQMTLSGMNVQQLPKEANKTLQEGTVALCFQADDLFSTCKYYAFVTSPQYLGQLNSIQCGQIFARGIIGEIEEALKLSASNPLNLQSFAEALIEKEPPIMNFLEANYLYNTNNDPNDCVLLLKYKNCLTDGSFLAIKMNTKNMDEKALNTAAASKPVIMMGTEKFVLDSIGKEYQKKNEPDLSPQQRQDSLDLLDSLEENEDAYNPEEVPAFIKEINMSLTLKLTGRELAIFGTPLILLEATRLFMESQQKRPSI